MRRTLTGMIFTCMFFALTFLRGAQQAGNAQQINTQDQLEALIREAISAVGKLKEGSIRSEVERDFILDGGLQSRGTSRYIFKNSRYIKIEVTFSNDERSGSWIDGSPEDRVVNVSKPYLEYPFTD